MIPENSSLSLNQWLALLAGAFFKVFPIFFAPLFLAMELKNFSRSSALRLIAVALISLLAFSLFPENMRTVIFNSARGIQVESIYSNILLVGEYFFGLGISIELNYGAHQLVLPAYAEALPQLALGIQVLSVFALSALFFLKGARKEELFVYAFLVATAMILFSKVFSTQFMLWPLIFAIPIFAMPWGNPRIQLKLFPQAAALYLSAAAAYFAYPVLGYLMVELSPLTLAALTAKNVLLFAVFAWVFLNRENFFLKED